MGLIVFGIACILVVIFAGWAWVGCLYGLQFVLVGTILWISTTYKARRYEAAERAYQERRQALQRRFDTRYRTNP